MPSQSDEPEKTRVSTKSLPDLPDRYAELRTIGKGAVGEVFRSFDTILKTEVAIKVTQQHMAEDKQFRRLFAREIRLNAQLVHPNVVPLHDAGMTANGMPYLVMSLADGGSFAQFRRFPPPWTELLRLTREVLKALAYLHAQGVLHRDLKPENVLLHRGKDGLVHAWLADLGAANATEDMPKEQVIGGTPMYIGPEHATGDLGQLDKASDLYALCAMIKEFVTGKPPFLAKSLEQLVELKEQEQEPWVSKPGYDVPLKAIQVLQRQLAPVPLDRYDLAADLLNALEAASDDSKLATQAAPKAQNQTLLKAVPAQGSAHDPAVGRERPAPDVPRWLQPKPKAMPPTPPLVRRENDPGRSSLGLFLYRRPHLVGRKQLLQQIWTAATQVVEKGAPKVLLLTGKAGVGKSHIVQCIASMLEEGGWMERLELRYQDPAAPTDGLQGALIRLIRPEAGSRYPITKRMQDKLARWRGQLTDRERKDAALLARRAKPKASVLRRSKVGDARWFLYEYLESHSWRGGSMLVIDDAHWAKEDDGLAYAEALLRSQGTLAIPAFVVATLRSEVLEENSALRRRCDALVAQGAQLIEVPPMNEDEVREVLSEYLTLEPTFLTELSSRCEGNPLFAHQLLEAWIQHRKLVDRGALKYGLEPGVTVDQALPSSTEALLLDRVEALVSRKKRPKEMRQALHLAALAGHEGPISLLASMLGGPWTQEVLSAAGIIRQHNEFFTFEHGLLRETLLREAEARADLQNLHLILARGWLNLEKHRGRGTGVRVANHLLAGGKPIEALNRALTAAQQAMRSARSGEGEEAALVAQKARLAAEVSEIDQRAIAADRYLAMAYEQQGRLQDAADIHHKLMVQAREHHAFRLEEVHLKDLGHIYTTQGRLSEALKHLGYAIKMAQARSDDASRLQCQRAIAEVHRRRGNLEQAGSLLEGCLTYAQSINNKEEEAWLLKELVRCRLLPGQDLRKEEAMIRTALKLAESLEDDRLVGECHATWAEIVKLRGDLSTARMRYARCFRFFAERQIAETAIVSLLNLALIDLTLGRPEGAQIFITDAFRWMHGNKNHWLRSTASLYEANALAQLGHMKQATAKFKMACQQGLGHSVDHDLPVPLEQLANIAHQKGSKGLAAATCKAAAHVWQKLGDSDEADRLNQQLRRWQSPSV